MTLIAMRVDHDDVATRIANPVRTWLLARMPAGLWTRCCPANRSGQLLIGRSLADRRTGVLRDALQLARDLRRSAGLTDHARQTRRER